MEQITDFMERYQHLPLQKFQASLDEQIRFLKKDNHPLADSYEKIQFFLSAGTPPKDLDPQNIAVLKRLTEHFVARGELSNEVLARLEARE